MKNFILFVFFVSFPFVAWSYNFIDSQGIAYSITSLSNKTVAVSSGGTCSGALVIPSTILYNRVTYDVTEIESSAFVNCATLTSVSIPNSVKKIGSSAFCQCSNITSFNIPDGVTYIGESAFYYCDQVPSITIPASVAFIGEKAFSFCNKVSSFVVDAANANYVSVDGVLFDKNMTSLIEYPANKTSTAYTIPNTVTSIKQFAFNASRSLTSITIPNSVQSFEYQSFRDCNNLSNISIPASVTAIDGNVFFICPGLSSITVDPANPNYTNVDGVLFNKDKTTLITYPAGRSQTNYSIPNKVQYIGDNAFLCAQHLRAVTLPCSVITIGTAAFFEAYYLEIINIPSSVKTIKDYAFISCGNLSSIHLQNANPVDISQSSNVFLRVPLNTCILFVPPTSKSKYQQADKWKDFLNIADEDPVCNFTPNEVTLSGKGETKTVSLSTTLVWNADSDQSWLTVSPPNGVCDGILSLNVGVNPTVQNRVAHISISVDDYSFQNLTVTQSPGPPTLSVSANSASVKGKEGSSGSVSVVSNTAWNASVSDAWLTLSQSSGTGNGELTFTASKNLSETARTATVTVSVLGCLDQVISVKQDPYIIASIIKKWNNVLICNNKTKQLVSYQWYKNENPISGATKQYYEENGLLSGNYYVKVMTTDNVEGQSNIYKSASSAKVMLCPNPTSSLQQSHLRISLPASDLTNARLVIHALSGQLVFESKALSTDVLLPQLKPGSYIVRIEPANEDVYTEKLVVY